MGAPASAQLCADTTPLASFQGVDSPGVLLASGMDVYSAMGSRLYSLDPPTLGDLGSSLLADTVVGIASEELMGGISAVVTATEDGYVRAYDGFPGSLLWDEYFFRGGCVNDTLETAPGVHQRAAASASFQSTFSTDLVYVATSYANSGTCTSGHDTDNKIFALNASSSAIEWVFNGPNTVDVDIVKGTVVDVANDRLYVTTDRTFSTAQHSVWALNVLTGSLVWSANAGRVWAEPVLHDGRLYVAELAGRLRAYDSATGALLWTSASLGAPLSAQSGGNPVVIARRVVLRCRPYATFAQPPRHLHRNDQEAHVSHWVTASMPWDAVDQGPS